MKAKSSEPLAEASGILQQVGETPITSADSAFSCIAEDLGELFLAELKRRRERLAKLVKLLQAEARLEQVSMRMPRPARPRCRGRATRRGDRSTIGRRAPRTR
jgi:hypothetical protein